MIAVISTDRPPLITGRIFPSSAPRVLELLRDEDGRVLDVGCANGAFCDFLLSELSTVRCTGLDAVRELVEYAARWIPGATFLEGDIRRADTLPEDRFRVVTMLTLHSHFDDPHEWLDNALRLVEPGGALLAFGAFNPDPVDVFVRLRVAEGAACVGELLPGWNILARATFATALRERGVWFQFHDYSPPPATSIPDDPLSSRAASLDGVPVMTNGACLVLPFAMLEMQP